MVQPPPILVEGYPPAELRALPPDALEPFILTGEPVAARAGSADVLCSFRLDDRRLTVEFAHIDGGGEGVLPTLWTLIENYARARGVQQIDRVVHALHCARPNLKLRRVLLRRGFVVREVPGIGEAYHYEQKL